MVLQKQLHSPQGKRTSFCSYDFVFHYYAKNVDKIKTSRNDKPMITRMSNSWTATVSNLIRTFFMTMQTLGI